MVSIKVGQKLLAFIKKKLPSNNSLTKDFNTNMLKLIYSWTKNLEKNYKNYNSKF